MDLSRTLVVEMHGLTQNEIFTQIPLRVDVAPCKYCKLCLAASLRITVLAPGFSSLHLCQDQTLNGISISLLSSEYPY